MPVKWLPSLIHTTILTHLHTLTKQFPTDTQFTATTAIDIHEAGWHWLPKSSHQYLPANIADTCSLMPCWLTNHGLQICCDWSSKSSHSPLLLQIKQISSYASWSTILGGSGYSFSPLRDWPVRYPEEYLCTTLLTSIDLGITHTQREKVNTHRAVRGTIECSTQDVVVSSVCRRCR